MATEIRHPDTTHVQRLLSRLAIGYRQGTFMSDSILPQINVDNQSDKYPVFGAEHLTVSPGYRAPGAPSEEMTWAWSDDEFFARKYGEHIARATEMLRNADAVLRVRQRDTRVLKLRRELAKEVRVKDKVTDASVITQNETLSGTDQWSDHDDSDPRAKVMAAKETVRQAIGMRPNTMVLSSEVLYHLRLNDSLKAYFQNVERPFLSMEQLKAAFELESILEADAVYNSANAGQTVSLADVWGDTVLLAYVNPSPSPVEEEKSLGYQFVWYPYYTRAWISDEREANITEVNHWQDEKVCCPEAGYLFIDVIAD